MGDSQKCVVNELFGFQHPYSYCVKPSDKMVNRDTFDKGGWLLNNTAKVIGGMFNYVDYLVTDPDVGTSDECKYKGKGVIGNKYVLKTDIECTPVDSTGKVIAVPGETGQSNSDMTGLIPSTFSSATKIADNVIDLISAFGGKTKPYCMKASVKCHLVDYNMKGVRGPRNYSGNSPQVYFATSDLRNLRSDDFYNGVFPTISNETFENIESTIPSISDNIINQNMDKIQNLSDLDKILNSINFDQAINSVNFEDELLVKTYYVGFSILLIIIIFKLVFKKK